MDENISIKLLFLIEALSVITHALKYLSHNTRE